MKKLHTRRRAIVAIASSIGALAAAPLARAQAQQPSMAEKPATPEHAALTAIHYEIDFKASPQRLYEAILDEKQFAAFSGMPATIDRTPGGAFSMFGGMILGRNVELIPDQRPNPRVVQAWRSASFDPGVYSIVHFEFKPRAAEATLIFDHTGFPAGHYDPLDSGWQHHYWEPLKKFLA
jgi:activator of HSP90 ATPase